MKTETEINNELILSFQPCYNPNDVGIPEQESLSVVDWVQKYRNVVKNQADILWLLCRKEFMSDRDLRLFAVWCARQTYQYCTEENPIDQRSIDAVDCAERFANGQATENELLAAWSAARSAAWSAAWSAAMPAAWPAARLAAWSAAWPAAWPAARSAQIDQLLTYFK